MGERPFAPLSAALIHTLPTPLRRLVRPVQFLLLLGAVGLAFGAASSSSRAAAGPLTVTAVTWDVIGLDSNNVNTGPAAFPIGVKVCNTGSDSATNVVATWSWKTTQTSFTGPAEGATVSVGTLGASACEQVFFEVTLNRSPSSRKKSRDYQITVTGDGSLSTAGPRRTLYIQPLVSQNRNSTKKLAGPGGCNLAYTVCDAPTTNVLAGQTYTYKLYAETSTAYKQVETFVNWPSFVRVTSTSATYSTPSGATSSSLYADACGWDPSTRACVGPVNIGVGKAGGRIVVTYTVKATATGTLNASDLKPVIYDFSGASYHYNADYSSFSLISSALTSRYELAATIAGDGTVTSSPAGTTSGGVSSGLNCGGVNTTCSVGYASGTSVTLTATPGAGQTFTGWSGGGCSGTATCTVTMDQSRSVTATFTGTSSYPLTVSKIGSGAVDADTGALDCGSTCAANYTDGTVVTLTATPSSGYTFDGWSGSGCSGTGTCQVTMSQARSVTATFSEITYALSVNTAGNGIVTTDVGVVYCGNGNTICSDVYGSGTVVTLTATPGTGHTLTGWGGACSGTASTCSVTMSEARTVSATFTGTTVYPLDVALGGSGTGSVSSSPAGISCGATCTANYDSGTSVTLTATAGGGSNVFTGWSGDCTGTSSTCTVTMSQARDVTASFGVPQTLTVTKSGAGSGTVTSSPAGISCGATCSADFTEGANVTLTATASTGSLFTGWSGDCSGSSSTCSVTMSQARAVTATFAAAFTLTVTKAGSGSGTVTADSGGLSCGSTCAADYLGGTTVVLTASAASGSRFSGWSGDCSGSGSTCTVTMSAARSVTATFVAVYTLAVTKSGSGSGSVSGSSGGLSCGSTCSVDYDSGTSVTLTATAASGSRFSGWSGACSGTSSTCTVTMTQARNVTATFVAIYTLAVTKSGSGSGSVSGDSGGLSCGATCSVDYDTGTSVTLTAIAASGSRFSGWSGDCSGSGSTCTVTMSAARNVTATFVAVYTLTVTKSGSGSGSVSADTGGLSCGLTCAVEYDTGTSVTLTATASSGSRFSGWSGDCSGSSSTCTVTMSAARSVTATFVAVYTLAVTKSGSGSGSVSGSSGGLSCGATCSVDYDTGTSVTLTAIAASGSRFSGWSGACSGSSTTCTVTMTQARNVTATFITIYALTVTKSGSGSGTVTANSGGLSCGATCSVDYDTGTSVTLTATPATGSRFSGWSGDCSGSGSTCTVTMTQARNVTATFVAVYTLSVTKSGSGSGSVTGSSGGLSCGLTCGVEYDTGTSVTLTATASSGSRFSGWSGDCSGSGSTCTVTMSAARSVTATFVAVYTLAVTKSGSGSGSVSGSSGGLSCGSTCSVDYDTGTSVTLTATAASGSRFSGWSGACSGTSSTCTVTMTQARNVTATFVAIYTLAVTKSGSGSGSVTANSGGLSCGSTCSVDYDGGTSVTLTATPATGSRFSGWSGDCSGSGSTCTVTMSAARNVTATFVTVYALTVTTTGNGTVTGTSINCGVLCAADYDTGSVVTLTAAAGGLASQFSGWSGACSGSGSTCTVTMSQARTVTATFVSLHTLTVTISGSGTGRVDCSSPCTSAFANGSTVTLTAVASTGSRFDGWSGACAGSQATCTVTMTESRTVTATFLARYMLTVAKTGSGTGTVTGTDVGCGSSCAAEFDDGTRVTLRADAPRGSRFTGWSGAPGCNGQTTCTVTMSEARTVTAIFVRSNVPLAVRVDGPGSVVGSGGLRCAKECERDYEAGERVRLEAEPREGYWFLGWRGACEGTDRTCTVQMDRRQSVEARFGRELELRLQIPDGLFYHLPYERGTLRALATWRGNPLPGAVVEFVMHCPGRPTVRNVLRTGEDGRAAISFGTEMPNPVRVYTCTIDGSVSAKGERSEADRPGTMKFIHPLWLDAELKNGRVVVSIWGRGPEHVQVWVDGRVAARTRLGANGWGQVVLRGADGNSRIHVTGHGDHSSHTITPHPASNGQRRARRG